MRIKIVLLCILAVLFLVLPASATYLQVENGTTERFVNTTTANSQGGYANDVQIFFPANVSGHVLFSLYEHWLSGGSDCIRYMKNGVQIGVEVCAIGFDWTYSNQTIYGMFNTSDSIWLQSTDSLSSVGQITNVGIWYNYTSVSITSPANNSAQTSRALNITFNYNGTGSVRGQFLTSSGSIICDQLSTTGWNNCTVPTGLITVRLQGNDTVNNSETNWTTYQFTVYDVASSNFNINGQYENSSWDRGDNTVWGSTIYRNNWANSQCSDVFYITGVVGCGSGFLWSNGTAANSFRLINNTNYSGDILVEIKSGGETWNNTNQRVGTVLRGNTTPGAVIYPLYSSFIRMRNNDRYIGRYPSSSPVWLASQTGVPFNTSIDSLYNFRINGTFFSHRMWNAGSAIPDWFAEVNSTENIYTYGHIGFITGGVNQTIYYIQAKPITPNGSVVINSSYILNDSTDYWQITGKNNTKPIAISVFFNSSIASNLTLEVNTSLDNITWSGWVSKGLIVSNQTYELPYSRYVNRKYIMQGNDTESVQIISDQIYLKNVSYIEGYIKYANNTAIPNATVGYFENWKSTDSNGYYNFTNMSYNGLLISGNLTFVTGKSGYNSIGEILLINESTIIQNFTLVPFVAEVKSTFPGLTIVNNAFPLTIQPFGFCVDCGILIAEGGYNGTYFEEDTVRDPYPSSYAMALSGLYDSGKNRTPELYERSLTVMERLRITLVNNVSNPDMKIFFFMYGYDFLADDLSQNVLERFNQSINSSMNYTKYLCWETLNNSISTVNNHCYIGAEAEQIKVKHNLTNSSDFFNKFLNIHYRGAYGNNGYFNKNESYAIVYNFYEVGAMVNMQNNGLVVNESINQTIQEGKNWIKSAVLLDGLIPTAGRSQGTPCDPGTVTYAGGLIKESWSYRIVDISQSKQEQYIGWRNNTFYNSLSYYSPMLFDNGFGWNNMNPCAFQYIVANARNYDGSVVEGDFSVETFDDVNNSGILKMNTDDGNYSVYMLPLYYSGEAGQSKQGDTVIPLRFVATVRNAMNQTISHMPAGNVEHEIQNNTDKNNASYNFISFNNNSRRIDYTAFKYTLDSNSHLVLTNVSHGISQNSMYMNWSNISFLDSTNFGYFNISIVKNNDKLNITYKFNRSNSDNFSLPLVFLVNDNRTQAIREVSGCPTDCQFNFSRGKEIVNITNVTGIGIVDLNISISNIDSGLSMYGWNNRTLLNGTLSGNEIILMYDLKISTTNSYPYTLNQPPGVWSYSPETPLNTGLGSQTFDIEFTQSLDNISWDINGTIKEWDNGTSVGSYTNSTAETGVYNVTATGCNAQGCASFSWLRTVDGDAPASISNASVTSNYTHVLMNWSNPLDADFSLTYWLNGSTWVGNLTNTSWNISGSPGQSINYSAQTVDALGNVNATKVWLNATILAVPVFVPPTPVSLVSAQGNFWINHTWQAGAGNITDSFNVSVNGTWTNGSLVNFSNGTVAPHGWRNISVWAFNNSGTGSLSLTEASNNTQVVNNAPVMDPIGNKNVNVSQWLNFTLNATDFDGDVIVYDMNVSNTLNNISYINTSEYSVGVNVFTKKFEYVVLNNYSNFNISFDLKSAGSYYSEAIIKKNGITITDVFSHLGSSYTKYYYNSTGKINSTDNLSLWIRWATGDTEAHARNFTIYLENGSDFSWLPTVNDVGIHYWNFNATDGYGGLDQENITVTVNATATEEQFVNRNQIWTII